MYPAKMNPSLSRQHGMTMVIVLIFLLLLTLLGVSSMSTANMQERMAANSQTQIGAFQTAESAIADEISKNTVFDSVMTGAAAVTAASTIGGTAVTTTTANIGSSLPYGYDLDAFIKNDFSINTVAHNPATDAHAENRQDVGIIGHKS